MTKFDDMGNYFEGVGDCLSKPREFWLCEEEIKILSRDCPFPHKLPLTCVREVLDPDPRDEVIKIMRKALESMLTYANAIDPRFSYKKVAKQALAAAEKVGKTKE